jgi:hypothetical protein
MYPCIIDDVPTNSLFHVRFIICLLPFKRTCVTKEMGENSQAFFCSRQCTVSEISDSQQLLTVFYKVRGSIPKAASKQSACVQIFVGVV